MPFIKIQKQKRAGNGKITGGSASIEDTVYGNFGGYHAKHRSVERLGKVIWLSEDRKSGIFLSPTRGIVEYDSAKGEFSPVGKGDARLKGTGMFPEPQAHVMLGDSCMLLEFLNAKGMTGILRKAFPDAQDYERVLCHVLHGVLKDGSKIPCDDFIVRSFASYVFSDIPIPSLKCDSGYFAMMGSDASRMAFFSSFVGRMKELCPDFGTACYVDSTPLPNDIQGNPFNALCCHGVGSSENMVRLVLVLDEKTGLPVWYDILPGNVLDIGTVMKVANDVSASLKVTIDSLVLDAGYVSKELLGAFHIGTEKTLIGRMPARKGFPYRELYDWTKPLLQKGRYAFVRNGHLYFGHRRQVEVFGQKEYAYVYLDRSNATKRFTDYLSQNQEEYDRMKESEKDWTSVRFGFFVLLSNIDETPERLLADYFGRCDIETVFKTSKEYLEMLPLSKWTDLTVRGKILHDVIDTIVVLLLRKSMDGSGSSLSELFGKTSALMCTGDGMGKAYPATPSKEAKQYYSLLGIEMPKDAIDIADFRSKVLGL